jgi:ectoine hydroxylase-related dioxygenase (phytanoyl-CoA dioxygenase family)
MGSAVCEKETAATPHIDVERAKQDFDVYGYVILKNLIPRNLADQMAERLKELMRADTKRKDEKLQTLNNTFDRFETQEEIDLFCHLVSNPVVLALAEHALGKDFQISDTGVLWLKANAGFSGFGWHADTPLEWFTKNHRALVDLCFGMNVLWMLTDFTKENGATRVVPFSHMSRRHPFGSHTGSDGQQHFDHEVVAEAPAGSCMVFNHALWHAAGGNFTDQDRIGCSNPHFPIWLDGGNVGWPPIKRNAYDRLPPHVQKLHRHVIEGTTRGGGIAG